MEHPANHTTILALGSNHEQAANMLKATAMLGKLMTRMRQSRCILTEPIGVSANRYLNAMVAGETMLTLADFKTALKRIEGLCGRNAEEQRQGIIRMDIDIMEFDGRRMHLDDWQREYIDTLYKEIK